MSKLLRFRDNKGLCFATLELDSKEPCFISVAQSGLLVKRQRLFFGPVLYHEPDLYKAAKTAMALDALYPDKRLPSGFSNPVLMAFTNAALHCSTAAQVAIIFNEAIDRLNTRQVIVETISQKEK